MKDDHDVIVIGAGVSGAMIGWTLAARGARVLLLEAGDQRDRRKMVGAFAAATNKAPSAPYLDPLRDAHAPYSIDSADKAQNHYIQGGPNDFKSGYVRLVGGSTWHFLGNTPRFVPNDFRLKTTYGVGVDWPLSYDDLELWYCEAESEMGVSGDHEEWDNVLGAWRSKRFPMTSIWPAYGDSVVSAKLDHQIFDGVQIHIRPTPQARNSRPYQDRPPCAGNSSCVPICPIEAKYDAGVHVRKAIQAGAELRERSVVKRLIADSNGKIIQVEYERWTPGNSSRQKLHASARIYVLAAHAIETPLIMLESKLSPAAPVGQNLMDHLQGYGGAIMPEPIFPFRGPPVTSGIDEFRDGAFRAKRAAFRISIGNDGWGRMEPLEVTIRKAIFERGLTGDALRRAVNHRGTRMLRLSYSTEMLPERHNRVTIGGYDEYGNPRPRIEFHFSDYNRNSFDFGNALLNRFFDRMGIGNGPDDRRLQKGDEYSGAGHIIGTCCMGLSRSNSVVDCDGRAHEHRNLFLAGASVFPTCGTANPTLTAAALALRTASVIQKELVGRRS
jgi:glucose dehydrogenase